MTTKPPRWLVRNVQAIAGPPVDVNGALAAAHDTDTEREGFIPARLSGAQVLSTVTGALAAAHDTDTEREGFIPARLSDAALKAALGLPILRRASLAGVRVAPAQDAAVMAAPPTGTLTGPTNTPVYATYLDQTTAQVTHIGSVLADVGVGGQTYKINTVNDPGTATQTPLSVEFLFYGDRFALKFPNRSAGSTNLRVYADGQPTAPAGYTTAAGSTGGQAYWLDVVFPSVALRTIRVDYSQAQFGGLSIPAGASVSPSPARRPRCAVLGDSWVGGAGGLAANDLIFYRFGQAMGWDTARLGIGGTGYVNNGGTFEPFGGPTRLARLATYAPEYCLVIGGLNDDATASATVGTAAATLFSNIAAQSPTTKLIVTGPQGLVAATPAGRLANRDAIKAAALAAPNVIAFLDPIAEAWIGPADGALLQADNTHPTVAGNLTWTTKLVQSLMRAS